MVAIGMLLSALNNGHGIYNRMLKFNPTINIASECYLQGISIHILQILAHEMYARTETVKCYLVTVHSEILFATTNALI